MEFETTRPLWAVLIGILVIPFLVASGEKRANQREAFTILASLIKAGVVLSLLPSVLEGRVPTATLWEITPGVSLALRVDGLGMVFGMVASVLWILTSFYSIGYVRGAKEHKQTRFYASFAMAVSSTIGIAFAANLVTFLIFFEMLTGQKPYRADSAMGIIYLHANEPIPVLPARYGKYQALLNMMLAKAPEDRLQSAEEIEEWL